MAKDKKVVSGGAAYRTQLRARPGKAQLRLRIRRLLRSFPKISHADEGKSSGDK